MRMVRSVTVMLALAAAMAAGCLSPADVDDADDAGTLEAEYRADIETSSVQGSIQVAAATPALSFTQGQEFTLEFAPGNSTTGYVIELVWDASYPTNQDLSLWVRQAGIGALPPEDPMNLLDATDTAARATGTSPLKLVVDVEDLQEHSRYEAVVRAPDPAGLAVQQPFELFVTEFVGVDLDEAFSALDGEGEDEGA